MNCHGHDVLGVEVDERTRCAHYDTDRDVVAIRLPCCGEFYPCFRCHEAVADHPATRWSADSFDAEAVLCGACGATHPIRDYLALHAGGPASPSSPSCSTSPACPTCDAAFNPGCADHHDRYFEV